MVTRVQHRAGCRTLIVAAVGALVALVFAGATPATASTVAGKITGAPIPAPGTGQAFVRAVSVQTGAVVAADDTDAAGRYRMTVPKGTFVLFPTVITLHTLFSPKPTRVRLKRGQRKSVRLPARAHATVLRPIVAMPDNSFTGGTGDFKVLNRGLRDMLITDLVDVKTPGCAVSLVDRSALGLAAIKLEFKLVRLGLTDPATAPRPGLVINPTRGIRGTITVTGGRMRLDAEIYKWSSKKTLHRTSVEGAQEEFFELETDLARRLAALLCEKPPPISGTFSGSLDYAKMIPVGVLLGKLDWTGSLELEPSPLPAGIPPQFGGATTTYQVKTGTVTAHLQGLTSAFGDCTISGQVTLDVPTLSPGGAPLPALLVTEGDPDTYRLGLDGGLGQIPTVLSLCPRGQEPSNGMTGVWPLLQIGLLPISFTPFIVKTEGVFAGSTTGTTPGLDAGYQWTWSLRG